MSNTEYLILVVAMGCVTFLPRWFPLFFLSQRQLPRWLVEWLELIPVAILSALIFPDLLTSGAPRQFDPLQLKALVAVPTLLFALKTRSLGGTVMVGMLLFWLTEKLLPLLS